MFKVPLMSSQPLGSMFIESHMVGPFTKFLYPMILDLRRPQLNLTALKCVASCDSDRDPFWSKKIARVFNIPNTLQKILTKSQCNLVLWRSRQIHY